MRKIKNPFLQREGYYCFGCCPENLMGLHLEFYENGDEIVSYWKPQPYYQGWVGVVHGGIIATLVDEVCGWVVTRKLQTAGMTSRMSVKYHRPLSSSDTQVTIRAKIATSHGRWQNIACTVENADGVLCAEGETVYCTFDEEKSKEMGFTYCGVEDEQLLPL